MKSTKSNADRRRMLDNMLNKQYDENNELIVTSEKRRQQMDVRLLRTIYGNHTRFIITH